MFQLDISLIMIHMFYLLDHIINLLYMYYLLLYIFIFLHHNVDHYDIMIIF